MSSTPAAPASTAPTAAPAAAAASFDPRLRTEERREERRSGHSASAFQRTDLNGSSTPLPLPTPAPEVTSELNQRAADGFLINGSAQNGAASPFAQNPAFGNNRKGGPHLYTGNFALVESNSSLDAANFSLTGQNTRNADSIC